MRPLESGIDINLVFIQGVPLSLTTNKPWSTIGQNILLFMQCIYLAQLFVYFCIQTEYDFKMKTRNSILEGRYPYQTTYTVVLDRIII